MVSREGTEQGLNARDAYVTCTCDVQPRIPVTYTSHYPERISRRVIPCSLELRNPFLSIPIQNRTPQSLTAGVRSRTEFFNVSPVAGNPLRVFLTMGEHRRGIIMNPIDPTPQALARLCSEIPQTSEVVRLPLVAFARHSRAAWRSGGDRRERAPPWFCGSFRAILTGSGSSIARFGRLTKFFSTSTTLPL
jgi:hypothetical protein